MRRVVLERPLWAALAALAVVRLVLAWRLGVSFEIAGAWWQLLDPPLLRDEPLRSLWLLHMQPPLFNALYAAAFALAGTAGPMALQAIYLGLSAVMVVVVYWFLRRFGYRAWAAAFLTTLFGVLPQVLVYENTFFYAHAEAALVTLAMFFATRFLDRHDPDGGTWFAGLVLCLVGLALLRSLFHVGWVALSLFVVWGLHRRRFGGSASRAGIIALAGLALVGAAIAKNAVVFGVWGLSSWQGVSAAVMTLPLRPEDAVNAPQLADDFQARVARGEFSPSARLAVSTPDFWSGWASAAPGCGARERRPALCAVRKSTGDYNLNNAAMIAYSRDLGGDALLGLRLYPALYARHIAASLITFLGTPSWTFMPAAPALSRYAAQWDRVLFHRPERIFSRAGERGSLWARIVGRLFAASLPLVVLVMASAAIVIVRGAGQAVACWHGHDAGADWIFPLLVLALVVVVPNLVNGGETNRMRYSIEPMLFLALADGTLSLLRRRSARLVRLFSLVL